MQPPPAPFSWRATLRGLRHPGPPPPGLSLIGLLLLTVGLAAVVILLWLGHVQHGNAHRYFEERKAGTYLSFVNLVATGALAAAIARRLRPSPFARFWRIAALGFAWLGLDDLFLIHERIDRAVHALLGLDPHDPLTDHLDDLIVASYGVAALWLAYRYRVDLARLRWMALVLGVAFPLFVGMVVLDMTHLSDTVEDSLKVMAGTLILISFVAARLEIAASTYLPSMRSVVRTASTLIASRPPGPRTR
jgi:hypothetical protein